MKLTEKQTGWQCAHLSVTAGVHLVSACWQGCEMQPIVVRYYEGNGSS